MIFKWDPATAAGNRKKHGVDFHEAASVLDDSMKKASKRSSNGMSPEYDFASMKGGVRGKYVKRLREGSKLVLLEPDVAVAVKGRSRIPKRAADR